MTGEKDKIYGNDYADFIIDYSGDLSVLEQYKENGYNIINFFLAVVYLPINQTIENLVAKMGYAAVPSILGLTSELSLESSGIPRLRNIPRLNLRGKGVLIGIVDSGIDYTNPIFQNADKTTRIASIWDQTIISDKQSEGIFFGTEYTQDEINQALQSENPYQIVPSTDEIGHGTMVAGIAAGNEVPESGFYGIATDSELVVVKLKFAKENIKRFFRIPDDAIAYQENDVIMGIQYLLNYSARVNKPLVLCITVDTSQYAHDGRGTTSGWLSLRAIIPGIAMLVSTGNEGNMRRHYMGTIREEKGFDTVELNVGPNENGFAMEIWGTAPNIFSIDITTPSGEYIPRIDIRFNETREITFIFDTTVIYLDYEIAESQSGAQLILIRFTRPSQGIWKFNVYSRGIFPTSFNIWLPMNNYISSETYFIKSNPNITLLTLACASNPITVTAYNTDDESLYIDAGRGYTRVNIVKPDIAAPGVNIVSPTLNHSFRMVTGTSAATAHTAGVAALLLEWGIVNGNYPGMSTQDIKVFLIRGARRKAGVTYPNPDWGYGILDVFNAFDSIRSGT